MSLPFCLMGCLLAFFCFKGAEMAAGAVDGRWLDPARFPLGGGSRRWRGWNQGPEELGCVPGRCASADGICYCDSNKSQRAMGLLRFIGALGFFSGGDEFESCWFAKDPGVPL